MAAAVVVTGVTLVNHAHNGGGVNAQAGVVIGNSGFPTLEQTIEIFPEGRDG